MFHRFPLRCAALIVTGVAVAGLPAADATAPDPAATAPAPAGDPALLGRITAQARTITTVAGRFEHRTTASDHPEDPPKIMTGVFFLEVPDKYNVVYSRPDDKVWRLRLCSDGVGHWQSEKQFESEDEDTRTQAGDAELDRVLACLRGDFTALGEDYAITADTLGDGAVVRLTPRDHDGHDIPVRIVLDHDLHAKSVDIDLPGGQHIQITVTAADYGKPSPAGSFTPPKP